MEFAVGLVMIISSWMGTMNNDVAFYSYQRGELKYLSYITNLSFAQRCESRGTDG